jgi:hypothetical protein
VDDISKKFEPIPISLIPMVTLQQLVAMGMHPSLAPLVVDNAARVIILHLYCNLW